VPLLGVSGSCFVMILAQSAATARFYAGRHGQHLDQSADLVVCRRPTRRRRFSGHLWWTEALLKPQWSKAPAAAASLPRWPPR